MPKLRVAVATVAALAGVATLSPVAASAAADRAPVRVHLSHGRVLAPASVQPGRAKLHNSGYGEILVVQPRGHHSAADLTHDIYDGGPDALLRDFTLVAELGPHQTAFSFLGRGRVLFIAPGSKSVTTTKVAGARRNALVGPATALTLDPANRVHLPASLPAQGLLRVVNGSPRVDSILAIRVGDDVSQQTVDGFVANPSDRKLIDLEPVDFRTVGLVAPLQRSWISYRLPAARWIVVVVGLRHHTRFLRPGGVAAITVR